MQKESCQIFSALLTLGERVPNNLKIHIFFLRLVLKYICVFIICITENTDDMLKGTTIIVQ